MKLIIDIGNTRIKAAIFEQKARINSYSFETVEELKKKAIFKGHKITHCMVATVVTETEELMRYLQPFVKPVLFTSQTPLPIKNLYKSPATLGSDRLLAAVGANAKYRDTNLLVIDVGTCVKYNFVNHKNEFIGGGISPGLQMRFTAVHFQTSRLPFVSPDDNYNQLVGTNTNESILSGIQCGIIAEVDGVIDQYRSLYNNLTVVLTGGDFNFFAKRLKNSIFADQFLILKGLNEILDTVIDE